MSDDQDDQDDQDSLLYPALVSQCYHRERIQDPTANFEFTSYRPVVEILRRDEQLLSNMSKTGVYAGIPLTARSDCLVHRLLKTVYKAGESWQCRLESSPTVHS